MWGHHEVTGHTVLFVINALGCEIFQKGHLLEVKYLVKSNQELRILMQNVE